MSTGAFGAQGQASLLSSRTSSGAIVQTSTCAQRSRQALSRVARLGCRVQVNKCSQCMHSIGRQPCSSAMPRTFAWYHRKCMTPRSVIPYTTKVLGFAPLKGQRPLSLEEFSSILRYRRALKSIEVLSCHLPSSGCPSGSVRCRLCHRGCASTSAAVVGGGAGGKELLAARCSAHTHILLRRARHRDGCGAR